MPETFEKSAQTHSTLNDLLLLTKFRLSVLVIVTTFVGFWLNSRGGINIGLLLHTLVGSTLAAFGAGVFNQLMEMQQDKLMNRTAGRPLPAQRMGPGLAFAIGWLLSAFALIHLAKMVNVEAAALCAITLGVYLFVYTPLKQQTAWNTIVGAISGALPPLIGWAGAVGQPVAPEAYIRVGLLLSPGAIYLFLLLFLWQLPHFLAINWIYRDEYRRGGFVMWANEDESGITTARLALSFSVCSAILALLPVAFGLVTQWFIPLAIVANSGLIWLAWRFLRSRDRAGARRLFFGTLLYLPLLLGISMVCWR